MKDTLERIKKEPYLNADEQEKLLAIFKANKISKGEMGLFIDIRQPAMWRKRRDLKIPRILGELFLEQVW